MSANLPRDDGAKDGEMMEMMYCGHQIWEMVKPKSENVVITGISEGM